MRRLGRRPAAATIGALALAAFALIPEGRLACAEPYLTETHPEGGWSVTICSRPRFFAMPGSGSDAPGWIVLRDRRGAVRGVSDLSMLQLYGMIPSETFWTRRRVSHPPVFELRLDPARNDLSRWWGERIWRWRALLGLTPSDEDAR